MKNLVEPIKLTEPVKPVKNQPLSVNQHKPQQNDGQSSGQHDFQAMLDKQVQERRLQDKQAESNKQQANASAKTNGKTTTKPDAQKTKVPTAEVQTTEVPNEEVLSEEVAGQSTTKAPLDHSAATKTTTKQAAKPDTSQSQATPKKVGELIDKKVDEGVDASVVEQKTTPKVASDVNTKLQAKDTNLANKLTRKQPEQSITKSVDEQALVESDAPSLEATKSLRPTKEVDKTTEFDGKLADNAAEGQVDVDESLKQQHFATTNAAQAPVDKRVASTTANETNNTDHLNESQTPVADKRIKSAEKQVLAADKTQVAATANKADIDAKSDLVAQAPTKELVDAQDMPKKSVISELQRTALEKRHQAKQLQKDMTSGQTRSAMARETVSERNASDIEAMPRSDRTSDFMQTMNLQAATVKATVQRPVAAETLKTDELKAVNNKTSESPTPVMSTQATATTNAAMQTSNIMAAAPLGSSNQIYAYPGKAGWNQAISQKVMYMVGASEQTARLSLNPPELGPLQVVIEVNDEKANTTFISDNEEVRQALEDGMDYLREKMDEAGIALGEANVNDGQRFNQSNQQEGFANTFNQNRGDQSRATVVSEEAVVTTKVQSTNNGLVDTFA